MDLDGIRVVLASPRNPLNIGAAARAMSNFGAMRLRVVNAYEVAYQEARSAVNASAVLTASEQFPDVAQAVSDCVLVVGTSSVGNRDLKHAIHRLDQSSALIAAALTRGPVALLFGSEKFGLSNVELAHCHWLMRIPTRTEHASMNLGQAVALCLYELVRSDQPETTPKAPARSAPASAEHVDLFYECLREILHESGYLQPLTSASGENKLRRLIRRLQLTQGDAFIWLGILRQILWRLKTPGMIS